MRGSPLFRFFTVAVAALMLSVSVPAFADGMGGAEEIPDGTVASQGTDPSTDSVAGVVGAAVCGMGTWLIRTNPAMGLNPGVLAATIAGCLLMLIDCFD